jgi:signal transduction histidine kinase/CheY-like chemotaxis protein
MQISGSVSRILKEKIEYSELFLQNIESLLINLSSVDDIRNTLEEEHTQQTSYDLLRLQAKMGYILSSYTNIRSLQSIDIISTGGRRYHVGESLLNDKMLNERAAQHIIGENQTDGGSVVWHGVSEDLDVPGKLVLIASRRLVKVDPETMLESTLGIIIVRFSLNDFNNKFNDVWQTGISLFAVDKQGRIIYSDKPEELGRSFTSCYKIELLSKKKSFDDVRVNGDKLILIKQVSEYNAWTYYTFINQSYTRALSSRFVTSTVILVFLVLLINIIVYMMYINHILTPIRQITDIFKQITHDEYDLSQPLVVRHKDEIGELVKWFNTFIRNLIERDEVLQELKQAKDAAVQANSAKDVFLANVSHELRTPLNGIVSVSEMLKQTDLPPNQSQLVDIIVQSGEILYSLINQVLDYSKIASDKMILIPNRCDLKSVSDNLANLYSLQAQSANIRFRYASDLKSSLYVMADEMALHKILINLIGNSLKFTLEGEFSFSIHTSTLQNDQIALSITVSDTGIGVPAEKQEAIFLPFVQVDGSLSKRFAGTGLGLAITRQLVDLMAGKIELHSPNPELSYGSYPGTMIRVDLLLQKATEEQDQIRISDFEEFQSKMKAAERSLSVLIVEDNPINQKVLKNILGRVKIGNMVASNGHECLSMVENASFDYIFMDIQMPDMDGFEATRLLRERGITTPIIAITGNALKDIQNQAFSSGMDDYIIKPVHLDDIKKILVKWSPL